MSIQHLRRRLFAVAALGVAGVALAWAQPTISATPTKPCPTPVGMAYCADDGTGDEPAPPSPGESAPAVANTSTPADPACAPTQIPEEGITVAYGLAGAFIPPTPSGDVPAAVGGEDTSDLWIDPCGEGGSYFWVDPDAGPQSVANPEDLAWIAYARAMDSLPDPLVAADPAGGKAAIIHTPTFVEVSNWIEGFTDEECDPPVCVTVAATPSLSFDPGDGSVAVTCDGPGSRYAAGQGSPEAQAAGACAHTYAMRTGVTGRPSEWPGVVTVTWDFVWTSTTGGTGTLPSVDLSADLPRSVEEVQAVVTEVG